jgi:hypothetical protein
VQALAGVTDRGVGGLTRTGGKAIERDREIVNSYVGHQSAPSLDELPAGISPFTG